jgi:hypothetical protein
LFAKTLAQKTANNIITDLISSGAKFEFYVGIKASFTRQPKIITCIYTHQTAASPKRKRTQKSEALFL